jgi:hypothetical protein
MDNNSNIPKKKRGRPTKLIPKERKKRIFKKKCPMCEDLNKNKILNVDKIYSVVDLKPVIVVFD